MTTYVGIRELEAELPGYLERAASGETIVATHRGKAEVRTLSVDERIPQGTREGRIHGGEEPPLRRRRSSPAGGQEEHRRGPCRRSRRVTSEVGSSEVGSSAFLELSLDEPESAVAAELLSAREWRAPTTRPSGRRNPASPLGDGDLQRVRLQPAPRWSHVDVIELDARVCEVAVELAGQAGLRALDALHVGAPRSLDPAVPPETFDRRLAGAARSLGWAVLPA